MIHRWKLLLLASGGMFLCGCFEAEYDKRLANTVALFAHDEKLNAMAGSPWSGNGIALRPPKQFELIPPPTPASPDAPATQPAADPRQPDFLGGMKLPGLLAAWKSQVSVDGQNVSAFMYLMSNQELLATPSTKSSENPMDFIKKTTEALANATRLKIEPQEWLNEAFPKKSDFIAQVSYQSFVKESPREVAGRLMRYSIYQKTEGNVQLLILFVVPSKSADAISEAIPWSLETLQVAPATGSAGSSAPPASPGAGI